MPQISDHTLFVAIQAVATEVKALREAVASGEAEPEEYQLLEDRIEAADDLERAYEVASRNVINWPPYEELIRG